MSDWPIAVLILLGWIVVGVIIGRYVAAFGENVWAYFLVAMWLGLGIAAGVLITDILSYPR